jgi:predicted MFS family arabinose efflux permease
MLELKQPTSILERIQNVIQDYPTLFWSSMTSTFINRLGTNLIMPFLAIYVVQRFDAKITQVGLIYTIFAVSSGAGNFLAGALADRFGIRRVVINSTFALGLLAGGFIGPRIGYRPLFVLDTLTSYFVALIVFSKLPETQQRKQLSPRKFYPDPGRLPASSIGWNVRSIHPDFDSDRHCLHADEHNTFGIFV